MRLFDSSLNGKATAWSVFFQALPLESKQIKKALNLNIT